MEMLPILLSYCSFSFVLSSKDSNNDSYICNKYILKIKFQKCFILGKFM